MLPGFNDIHQCPHGTEYDCLGRCDKCKGCEVPNALYDPVTRKLYRHPLAHEPRGPVFGWYEVEMPRPRCKTCGDTRTLVSYAMAAPAGFVAGTVTLIGRGDGEPVRGYVDGVERPGLVRETVEACPDCSASSG